MATTPTSKMTVKRCTKEDTTAMPSILGMSGGTPSASQQLNGEPQADHVHVPGHHGHDHQDVHEGVRPPGDATLQLGDGVGQGAARGVRDPPQQPGEDDHE